MRAGVSRGRPLFNLALAALSLVLSILSSPLPAAAQQAEGGESVALAPSQQAGCSFTLGFKALRDRIPDVVGQCLENERFNPANGNAEQRTTRGLLVWRKLDNWTAFTDGATTWINGPFGLQSRPNTATFPWEGTAASAGAPAPAATASAPATANVATLTQSGWAAVAQVIGPDVLIVQNEVGERFYVRHIGLLGPSQLQGEWLRQATAEHARRFPPGTRVWLQAEDRLPNPEPQWTLRPVLREGAPGQPVGGELLRAGGVWVFPHAHHSYVQLYADLQAEAVVTRSGAWGETPSSAIYRPRGVAAGGYPINPAVEPALRALDASEIGNAVLKQVNAFPVEIGVTRGTPPGVVAYFDWRHYSIQLAEGIMSAAPESIAAALLHELVHARQLADRTIEDRDVGCYGGEVEAFNAAAQYWAAVHGPSGKQRETHWLDQELNMTLQQHRSGQLEERVRRSYGHQCG